MSGSRNYQECAHCGGWINTQWVHFLVLKMRNGTTKHTHYQKYGGCAKWFQQDHKDEIESVQLYERRGGDYLPKDYAT